MHVCWIGRLDAVKNYQSFLDWAKINHGLHPQDVVTLICGSKNAKLRCELSEYYPYVRLLGYVSDIRSFLKTQDCLVITSVAEGSPAVILEGRNAGCKVIALNEVGAIREMLNKPLRNYCYEEVGDRWNKLLEKL